ncbi:ImmA/IrrE family metallo-endopeptidase [Bosea sp. CS1GBMeth4]|uniref:ImmA/IrrE family metallo-endopeptidase n=1 Tax=Bosea sp. CS1GBMeth4 TaxID=1892849 RepID=UPI001FCE6C9F|nr:ImmA/IrrE family metallo-endopeptidase [Bosea sp. CS1GBMeth4]
MLLPKPPRDFQPLRDFRRIDELGGGAMPARVAFEIRQAQERREIALDLLDDGAGGSEAFTLRAALTDDVEAVAAKVCKFLGADFADQSRAARRGLAFAYWRDLIESKDVLVFVMAGSQAPKVREVRGFAVPFDRLPIVAVNGRDKTAGRAFTLLHEFAHLLLGTAVVENAVQPGPWLPPAERKIERFCNAVAAAVLIPADEAAKIARLRDKGPTAAWADPELDATAEMFGASREAALLRMVKLGFAAQRFYVHKRKAFEAEYERLDDRVAGEGFALPHLTMVGRYGKSFARLVLNSYRERRITMNDAAAYLNIQAKHISAVEKQAFRAA